MPRQTNSVNLQFLLSEIRDYMLTQKNIHNIESTIKLDSAKDKDKQNESVPKNIPSINISLFIPPEKDALFWCFYIMYKGLSHYEMLFQRTFQEEKTQKIKMVELIREHKVLLKSRKWKRTQIEDDLVNRPTISMPTFLCLCAVHQMNIMIIANKRCYSDRKENENTHIIEQTDKGYGLYLLDDQALQKKLLFYEKTYWCIDQWEKPLKAISHYKIKVLQEICKKLDLPIEYKTTKGLTKRIKKIDLYNAIKQVL